MFPAATRGVIGQSPGTVKHNIKKTSDNCQRSKTRSISLCFHIKFSCKAMDHLTFKVCFNDHMNSCADRPAPLINLPRYTRRKNCDQIQSSHPMAIIVSTIKSIPLYIHQSNSQSTCNQRFRAFHLIRLADEMTQRIY